MRHRGTAGQGGSKTGREAAGQGGRQWDKTGSKTVEQGRQLDSLVRQRDSRAGRRTSQGGTRQAAEQG